MLKALRHGGAVAWTLFGAFVVMAGLSALLLKHVAVLHFERAVTRMVFNDNLEALDDAKRRAGVRDPMVDSVLTAPAAAPDTAPYIVVSIAENRLWYKRGDDVLYSTRVATGTGKTLGHDGKTFKFDTPRGRLVVERKDVEPMWVPPDWHYIEAAKKKNVSLLQLQRGQAVKTRDGAVVTVSGNDVVKRWPDGREEPYGVGSGQEIIVDGRMIIPPFGTNQRKYPGVLGTHRLYLGDGYALHGTDQPQSIGRSASHGCVRLRNEDIETLFQIVPLGTPVFIY